jgi:hypothetical protein
MKKQITLLVMAILMMPLTGMAQSNIFEKYSDNDKVSYLSLKPKMFQMLAKIDMDTDDKNAKEYMDMVNSITSFKTMATDDKAIAKDIDKWVKTKSGSLEELMEMKDNGVELKVYIKEGKDDNHVTELLMHINGLGAIMGDNEVEVNGEKRKLETVIVSFTGDIDLRQISKLVSKMDLPGGDELSKSNKN